MAPFYIKKVTQVLPDPTSPDFPSTLKEKRKAAGLSRAELARRARIHAVMPRRYEEPNDQAFARPTHNTWLALNAALGLNSNAPPTPVTEPLQGRLLSNATIEEIVGELGKRGITAILEFPKATSAAA
jgi:transcriptional regulator with XRE-family HTH domain